MVAIRFKVNAWCDRDLSYLFIIREGQILAHTFSDGLPRKLIGINTPKDNENGNSKRIVTDKSESYLDIAWPIFSGKAGVLRIVIFRETIQIRNCEIMVPDDRHHPGNTYPRLICCEIDRWNVPLIKSVSQIGTLITILNNDKFRLFQFKCAGSLQDAIEVTDSFLDTETISIKFNKFCRKSLAWTVRIGDVAERQLQKLDRSVQRYILDWLNDRIEGCKNPRNFGEPLRGDYAGLWRYRVRDYRILCDIQDQTIVFLVLTIGHRRQIYKRGSWVYIINPSLFTKKVEVSTPALSQWNGHSLHQSPYAGHHKPEWLRRLTPIWNFISFDCFPHVMFKKRMRL